MRASRQQILRQFVERIDARPVAADEAADLPAKQRGESDKNYDWVTGFEKDTGCKVNVKTAATSDEMVTLMNQGGFDLVTAICVLHHVAPAEWAHFMKEMRRVVRPGGLICVIEHNPLNPLTRLAVARCEFDRDAVLLGAGKARKLMAAGGLREIGARYFLLLPWEAKPARRVEGALSNVPLGAQYAAFGTA